MYTPETSIALLMMITSAICWGSWANTQKLAGKDAGGTIEILLVGVVIVVNFLSGNNDAAVDFAIEDLHGTDR